MDVIYVLVDHNELLTKSELCERILKCDEKTADRHYLYQPNFPYVLQGKTRRYPKKQVEEWIENNTHYT